MPRMNTAGDEDRFKTIVERTANIGGRAVANRQCSGLVGVSAQRLGARHSLAVDWRMRLAGNPGFAPQFRIEIGDRSGAWHQTVAVPSVIARPRCRRRRVDSEEKTAGGIIIPDTAKEKPSGRRSHRRRPRRP
jgi:hypothetical protein